MKYKLLIFFILTFFAVITTNIVMAQNLTKQEFDSAYNQYSMKNEEYNNEHDAYNLARSQYLKFKTLASKTNAQSATARMLKSRDDVVIYYLLAIKARLNDNSLDISQDRKNGLFERIDAEVAWFNTHKAGISEDNSLEDLISKSDEASVRFKNLSYTIYDSLYSISGGRILKYRERFNDIFVMIVDLVDKIRNENRQEYSLSGEKLAVIDRWIAEIKDQLGKTTESELKADEAATTFGEKNDNKPVYDKSMKSLIEANNYLNDSVSYTQEIIREIKVAE